MLSRLGLLVASTAFALLSLEAGLRVVERVTSVDFFHVMRTEAVVTDESALRVRDLIQLSPNPEFMYSLNPRVVGSFKGFPVAINASGFRGPEIPLQRADPATLRIVGIGDSVMFGWGVSEPDALLAQIRTTLGARHPDDPAVETLNLGVPGYNTHQEVEFFATRGLTYRPDLVVLLFVGNDDDLANWFHHRPGLLSTQRSYLFDLIEVRFKRLIGLPII